MTEAKEDGTVLVRKTGAFVVGTKWKWQSQLREVIAAGRAERGPYEDPISNQYSLSLLRVETPSHVNQATCTVSISRDQGLEIF
jgi:hypothetical protein